MNFFYEYKSSTFTDHVSVPNKVNVISTFNAKEFVLNFGTIVFSTDSANQE